MSNQEERGKYNLVYSSNSNSLFLPKRNKSEPPDNWYRAGGDCICATCMQPYHKHKMLKFGNPDMPLILNKLCNGDLVKL